jgi:hypothetical protein
MLARQSVATKMHENLFVPFAVRKNKQKEIAREGDLFEKTTRD